MLVKVELQRHQGHALLAELSVQVVNLVAVQQQLALAVRVNIPHAAV